MIPRMAVHGSERFAIFRSSDLVWLVLLALVLRVVYLLAGLSSQNLIAMAMMAPDSRVYVQLADYLRTGQGEAGSQMLLAGPGYPMWLAAQQQWEGLLVLGSTYGFFTWTTGFSFWQGSRLHFPAEMAWSILLSYFLVFIGPWTYSFLRRNRTTAPLCLLLKTPA